MHWILAAQSPHFSEPHIASMSDTSHPHLSPRPIFGNNPETPPVPDIGERDQLDVEEPVDASQVEAPKGWRKGLLVSLLCGAQLFDIFTACSAMAALPTVRKSCPMYGSD